MQQPSNKERRAPSDHFRFADDCLVIFFLPLLGPSLVGHGRKCLVNVAGSDFVLLSILGRLQKLGQQFSILRGRWASGTSPRQGFALDQSSVGLNAKQTFGRAAKEFASVVTTTVWMGQWGRLHPKHVSTLVSSVLPSFQDRQGAPVAHGKFQGLLAAYDHFAKFFWCPLVLRHCVLSVKCFNGFRQGCFVQLSTIQNGLILGMVVSIASRNDGR
mmetsp:Transcript_20393/g.44147  ORF Transcript_20393/g.44147 Transcript_20393/m.44147 type:complete len:215 (+) Transcript_20393:4811-5455(+)